MPFAVPELPGTGQPGLDRTDTGDLTSIRDPSGLAGSLARCRRHDPLVVANKTELGLAKRNPTSINASGYDLSGLTAMALTQGHSGKNDVMPATAGIQNRPVGRCLFRIPDSGLRRNDEENAGSLVK